MKFSLILGCLASVAPHAQDTRTVTEPAFPPACATFNALLTRSGASLVAEDEQKLDTARIQSALDQCTPGHATMLRRHPHRGALCRFEKQVLDRSGLDCRRRIFKTHALLSCRRSQPHIFIIDVLHGAREIKSQLF